MSQPETHIPAGELIAGEHRVWHEAEGRASGFRDVLTVAPVIGGRRQERRVTVELDGGVTMTVGIREQVRVERVDPDAPEPKVARVRPGEDGPVVEQGTIASGGPDGARIAAGFLTKPPAYVTLRTKVSAPGPRGHGGIDVEVEASGEAVEAVAALRGAIAGVRHDSQEGGDAE